MIRARAKFTGSGLRNLRRMGDRAQNLRRPYRRTAARLHQDVMRNFRQGGWYPEAWAPSKKDGGKTLVDTATLRNSFTRQSGADFAATGTSLFYAAVHQEGRTIRAVNGQYLHFNVGGAWVRTPQVTIPARPMLPVDSAGRLHPTTARTIQGYFADHITGGNS